MTARRFLSSDWLLCFVRPLAAGLAAASVSTAALAAATSVFESSAGSGFLLGTAQSAGSVTDKTSIFGNLRDGRGGNTPNFVDLFKFSANRDGNYFFNTIGAFGSTIADPALFLFDAAGNGLYWNNDVSLSPADTESGFVQSLFVGDYYLGVAFYGAEAYSGLDAIFDTLVSNQGSASTGVGALDNWQNFSTFSNIWDVSGYQVDIKVPEPSALALAGLALGLMGWTSRRRVQGFRGSGSPA
ncbi:MAG: PEP-CTERM sorting domain-containing protein [Rubrivivax sp.]|nr:PEP-CTERM sorting domain-containing protein [Rubrivivax sp.]